MANESRIGPEVEAWTQRLLPGTLWETQTCSALPDLLLLQGVGQAVPGYLTPSCPSTMDVAWALIREDRFPEFAWILTMDQTRGRGPFGRPWDQGIGNLYASVRLPDRAAAGRLTTPLAVGGILADALGAERLPVEIKWPNDLLVGGKKIGGILIEEKQGRVVAGIGINIKTRPEPGTQARAYRIQAGSLSEFGNPVDAPGLWQQIIRCFREGLPTLLAQPETIREKVEQILAFKDESVLVEQGNGENRPARIMGIHGNGGLVIQTPAGRQVLESGRIIPRIEI